MQNNTSRTSLKITSMQSISKCGISLSLMLVAIMFSSITRLYASLCLPDITTLEKHSNGDAMPSIIQNQNVGILEEICDNRIDDDGDGLIDCMDPDCSGDLSCWDCDEDFFQIHSNTTIVRLNAKTGAYEQVGLISGAEAINGASMSHIDGHVYAPCIIDGNHTLGMLMTDGSVRNLGLDLPGNSILYVGGVSIDGQLYVNGGQNPIYKIDLTVPDLSVVATNSSNPGVADFAVDNTTGLFYGVSGSDQLKVYDPFMDKLSAYDLAGSITNEKGGYGATWSSVDGSFFAYNNSSGKIFSVDINTLTATEVLNGVGNLSINDGFNCLSSKPPFETLCNNGIDDDGDGVIDCADGDCFKSNVCTYEICDNGIDDDNDGWTDCSDTECFDLQLCIEICGNGLDDNGNGLIDGEDPQCSTPPGVQGGLESNGSLADVIARRNIEISLERKDDFELKSEGLIPFFPRSTRGQFDLSNFIPTQVKEAYIADSTPEDLVDITNAEDVIAADYYIGDQRVGSILAIESNGIYEHTKYICDRLEGSRLLDISQLYAKGGLYMSYELLNTQLDVEYALSFSMHYEPSRGFIIENHWNLASYPKDKEYYNFQIWAGDYQQLLELLDATLRKVIEKDIIYKVNNSDLPRLFVTQGDYRNGNLRLQVRNKDGVEKCKFTASIRRTETSDWAEVTYDIYLSGNQSEFIDIPIGYIYDLGGSLQSFDSTSDEIFLADGRWTVPNDHPGARIINQSITEHRHASNNIEEYQIERSISVKAEVTDYLNIYRSIDPKFKPVDLTEYSSLSLDASGEGVLEITMVKSSIDQWENQPRMSLRLQESERTYNIYPQDLSNNSDWSDIVMLVFTMINRDGTTSLLDVNLSNITFGQKILSNTTEVNVQYTNSSIVPNPVSNVAVIHFQGTQMSQGDIHIMNTIGQSDMMIPLSISKEIQQVEIDLRHLQSGYYYYSIIQEGAIIGSGSFTKN